MRLKSLLRPASVVLAAPLLMVTALTVPATSAAQDSADFRQYRCTVLGEKSACPKASTAPADRTEVRVEPGPYALYLMHLGQKADDAIEEARGIGERPLRRTVRITTRQFTPMEAHERYLGRLGAPVEVQQILAEAPIETDAVQACVTLAESTRN